jgi:hypothetical protein
MQKPITPEARLARDRRVVLAAALFHLALVAVISGLIGGLSKTREMCIPVTYTYFAQRPGTSFTNSTTNVTALARPQSATLPGPGICPIYLALAFVAIESAFLFTSGFWYEDYMDEIERTQVNPYRWVSYAVSSSVMLLAVLATTGVTDFAAIFASTYCNVGMILCGWWGESTAAHVDLCNALLGEWDDINEKTRKHGKRRSSTRRISVVPETINPDPHPELSQAYDAARIQADTERDLLILKSDALHGLGLRFRPWKWTPFLMGCVLGLAPWVGIFHSFARTAAAVQPPWFVVTFLVQLMLFFFCFAAVEALWISQSSWGRGFCCGGKRGKPWIGAYDSKERAYTWLSLAAKGTLALFIASAAATA